jgi:hypothetical protein
MVNPTGMNPTSAARQIRPAESGSECPIGALYQLMDNGAEINIEGRIYSDADETRNRVELAYVDQNNRSAGVSTRAELSASINEFFPNREDRDIFCQYLTSIIAYDQRLNMSRIMSERTLNLSGLIHEFQQNSLPSEQEIRGLIRQYFPPSAAQDTTEPEGTPGINNPAPRPSIRGGNIDILG